MATARELLDQKLVNGEITEEEYDRLAAKLSGKPEKQVVTSIAKSVDINYRVIISVIGAIAAVYFSYKTINFAMAVVQLPTLSTDSQNTIFYIGVFGSIYAAIISIVTVRSNVNLILKIISSAYYLIVLFFLFIARGNLSYQYTVRQSDQFMISDFYIASGIIAIAALFSSAIVKESQSAAQKLEADRAEPAASPKWLVEAITMGVFLIISVVIGFIFSFVMRTVGIQGGLIPVLTLIVIGASFVLILRRYKKNYNPREGAAQE